MVHAATGRPKPVTFEKASQTELVKYLADANIYVRETAQRLLSEKRCSEVVTQLESIVLNDATPHKQRMHSLWALVGGQAVSPEFANKLLQEKDNTVRAWGVRATGSLLADNEALAKQVSDLAKDASRDVQLQVAIAAKKLKHVDAIKVWLDVLSSCGDDPLIPHIVWQNLHPQLPADSERLLTMVETINIETAPGLAALLPELPRNCRTQNSLQLIFTSSQARRERA